MALSPTRVSREPCSLPPPGDDPPVTPRMWGLPAPPYPPGGAYSPYALVGGTANRGLVIRVGDTVVRPTAPCWM